MKLKRTDLSHIFQESRRVYGSECRSNQFGIFHRKGKEAYSMKDLGKGADLADFLLPAQMLKVELPDDCHVDVYCYGRDSWERQLLGNMTVTIKGGKIVSCEEGGVRSPLTRIESRLQWDNQ